MHLLDAADFALEGTPRWLPTSTRSVAVLVVEDEPMLGIELASVLQDRGANAVGPLASRPAAMSALANVQVDAAILDLVLHGDVSFEIADLLEAACIPFVFYTGLDTRLIPFRHRNVLCLQKPLAANHVVRHLLTMLDT